MTAGAPVLQDAIVLRLTDYRERDRIVTVYSREAGRIGVVARGARGSRRRFGGALDLFVRADLLLSVAGGLPTLLEVRPSATHEALRTDLIRYAIASFMAELTLASTPDGERAEAQFDWLAASLGALDTSTASNRRDLVLGFQIGWFHLLGVLPPLDPESLEEAGLPGLDEKAAAIGRVLLRPSPDPVELDVDSARALGLLTRHVREGLVNRPLSSIAFLAEVLRDEVPSAR